MRDIAENGSQVALYGEHRRWPCRWPARAIAIENVLLDGSGHCRLSDLGLAVVTKVKIKGYAGTPGCQYQLQHARALQLQLQA